MFERFHFCRRNDNGMHIPVIQILNQRVIIRENLNPHHRLVDQFRFIGYETAQAVMITKTDAQCLCNIYSGLFGSINNTLALREPSKFNASKKIFTTMREHAIMAKLMI